MLKKAVLVAAALCVVMAPAALADHAGPNACPDVTPLVGSGSAGDHAGVCTPFGFLVVGGDANRGAYVYADGSDSNPEGIQGYLVIGVKTDGTTFCQTQGNPGSWNHSYSGPQACVV